MATNLALDDKLIEEAVKLGKHKTKREAVNAALKAYIGRKQLSKMNKLIGTIDYYDDSPAVRTKRPR